MSNMFLNVVSTFKGDGLGAATRQLGAFGKAAGGLGSTIGKLGAGLASLGAITKTVQFTQASIESARDLERNLFSVNTIFDDMAPTMVEFSKNAENIGLSQKDAAKAVTFLGSVLKQSGFSMADVTTETKKLVTLGVDLAATYGYDVQEALLGMTALFRGEYDPIEKFGVAMKQSEINSELAARGLNKLEGAARRNAEQVIRMELLYQRAADASGAFTAQSGNLFVEQKKLSAQFENMQATVGTALLPAMGALVQTLKPLVDELTPRLVQAVTDAGPALQMMTDLLRDASDTSTTTGSTLSYLADTLGTVFRLVSENLGLIIQLAVVFGAARLAVVLFNAALALTPFGAVAIGVGVVSAAVLIGIDDFKKYRAELERTGDGLTDFGKDVVAFSGASQKLTGIITPQLKLFKDLTVIIRNYILELKGIPTSVKTTVRVDYETGPNVGFGSKGGTGIVFPGSGTDAGAGVETGGGGGRPRQPTLIQSLQKQAKIARKTAKLVGKGLSEGLAQQIVSNNAPIRSANKVLKRIAATGGKFARRIQRIYNNTAAGQAEAAQAAAEQARIQEEANRAAEESAREAAEQAEELARAQEEAARAEAEALAERERIYNSFLDSVQNTFGQIKNAIMGAFDITGLGNSTNSIIRNLGKLLEKTRGFANNISQLASMGLDPMLLQQVISSGPVAGARLAAALVAGGAGALGQINTAYGEFGSLASGIAGVGTTSRFGNEAQQNIYNINVSGGVGSGATIGQAIVEAIKAYERTSGAVWQGA